MEFLFGFQKGVCTHYSDTQPRAKSQAPHWRNWILIRTARKKLLDIKGKAAQQKTIRF